MAGQSVLAHGRHRAPSRATVRPSPGGARKAGFRLVGFLGVLALVLSGLAVLPKLVPNLLVRALADQSAAPAAKPRVGDTVTIDSASGRPDLSWRVDGVHEAIRPGKAGNAGRQVYVVDLAIANKGDTAWTWDEATQISVIDAQGVGHAPRRLPHDFVLLPGQSGQTEVRYSLGGKAAVAKVIARVGPGLPQPATWLVP